MKILITIWHRCGLPGILLLFIPLFITCNGEKNKEQGKITETLIQFRQKHTDFGTLKEGETVAKTFYFKNTGKSDFLIRSIETGCGCSTAKYPQKPVPPGKEEKIEIIFNSSGRYGKQYKEISIFANIPNGREILTITADVR